jgi:type II secretory pathway component PulF
VGWSVVRGSEGSAGVAFDGARLKLPLLGSILKKAAILQFARTLGFLLKAGVDVISSLEIAIAALSSVFLRKSLGRVASSLGRGETLVAALEASAVFDRTFLQLVRAGEESGSPDAMLLRVADHYETEVESELAALSRLIEPALIVVIGAVIGTIVASIIIPLYSLIGSIK